MSQAAMSDTQRKETERRFRRRIFVSCFVVVALPMATLLLWKLRTLLLPIVVGALMAYLFRPLKDRFQFSWLPHELRVLALFACVGLCLAGAFNKARGMIPDEKQKLELKVRLKYKMNRKFQEIVVGTSHESPLSPLRQIASKELTPLMEQVNQILDLDATETDLFLKYAKGYKGREPIDKRFVEYFKANQQEATAATDGITTSAPHDANEGVSSDLMEKLSIWILAPLIFIFMGFDNGQMRRYFIGLVPNRYFELSLTVLDMLDEAIGKYLRGTLLECTLVGTTLALGLTLLGLPVPLAFLIGCISGFANAIPFLGPAIGLVIGLGYALIAESVWPLIPGVGPDDLVIAVVILIGITHLLDNIVFQPIVLGNAVNLHPLVVTVAIISGSLLMGVWGMLLAIPAVVVVKTAVETLFKELKDYRII